MSSNIPVKLDREEEKREGSDFDQLCKRLVKEFFREFLDFFFPELCEKINFEEVHFVDKELFSGQIEGEKTISDILAEVKLLDEEEEIVLLHFEFQSNKETDFSARMFDYYIDIWREYRKRIFAFALFIDESLTWRVPVSDTFEMEFMGTKISYKYHLRKSKDYDYRDYLDHENPITAALMARMNFAGASKALVKAEALNKLSKYNLSPLQKEILANFIEKLLFLNDEEKKEFKVLIKETERFKEVDNVLTVWHEEGIKEGELKGKLEVAEKLLDKKFSIEEIADLTGLEIEEIQKLADKGKTIC